MPLPKKITPTALNALKGNLSNPQDQLNYETHDQVIKGHNQLIESLSPGNPFTAASFSLTPGLGANAQISFISGTFKRGKFTVTTGASGFSANPTVTLNFPQGLFTSQPFAIVTRNGGTGALGFTYAETVNSLIITLNGTPAASTTYNFQFAMRD